MKFFYLFTECMSDKYKMFARLLIFLNYIICKQSKQYQCQNIQSCNYTIDPSQQIEQREMPSKYNESKSQVTKKVTFRRKVILDIFTFSRKLEENMIRMIN